MRTILCLLSVFCLHAEVKLPALFSDHMVLQRRLPTRVWGTASPGEKIAIQLDSLRATATANAEGKWTAALPPHEAGGPYELKVNSIAVHDVLVGEVWLASGQSNMVVQLTRANDPEKEISAANHPRMRFFQTPSKVAEGPIDDVNAKWTICTPDVAKSYAAVAYFFARDLMQQYDVPVGIVHSAVGGTPAEAWTAMPALQADPILRVYLDNWKKTLDNYPAAFAKFEERKKEPRKAGQAALQPPPGPGHRNTPSGLYNGMIAPLVGYTIRGAIWYQGEGNSRMPGTYQRLFETMIRDWRMAWGQGDFPFLFVQLANYLHRDDWAELQESQRRTLGLRNTAMAIITDIGDPTNIHPTNKQDVGHRLARAARAVAYGERITYSGPLFQQVTPEGSALRVWFDQTGGALKTKDGAAPKTFEIAGGDGKFVAAVAKIEQDTVVISSPDVREPVAVRYAWGGDPVVNLINAEGLPASPFKSMR